MAYGMDYMALRYFNAAGAALGDSIGEDHNPESHLTPLILKTAQGVRDHISIYGTDYPMLAPSCNDHWGLFSPLCKILLDICRYP